MPGIEDIVDLLIAQLLAAKAELAKLKAAPLYGYGIVDKDGKPFRSYSFSYYADKQAEICRQILNRDHPNDAPYRVVRLVIQEIENERM